ncbi:tumor susceptibility gene 101 isoform X2 [Lycorma delicatula]
MLPSEEVKIRQYLSKYQNPEATRRDIFSALSQYHGLSCKLEPFVFSDGARMELVNLEGTIPVKYKVFSSGVQCELANLQGTIPVTYLGHIYNIPVCIWLMDTHPNNAPICYVRPTPEMSIKISCFVDQSGKIYLPYLHDWLPTSSDLLGLIQVMIVTFGEMPPLYTKSRAESAVPYPTHPSFMPMPGSNSSAGAGSSTPYPAYPPTTGYPPPPQGYPPYPRMGGYPATGSPAYQPPVPPQQTHSYPPYPNQSSFNTATNIQQGTGTITEEHIRVSLLSAVEDKFFRRLEEQFAQSKAELDILQQTANELSQGKNHLDKVLERLEKEKNELERNITLLKEKEDELDKAISRLSDKEDIDVDEAVTTTAPLYKQILNAYAEEAATEDTIYYMGEALRRGVIDLDIFLKQVRALSRKQFMLRALMQKCRLKAGLAG